MQSLILSCGEDSCLSASCAFDHFFLGLGNFFLLGFFVLLLLLCFLFFLLFDIIEELEGTELLTFQPFILLVYDNSNKNFYDYFFHLFADLIEISVFIGLNIVCPC